jgi:AMMECR1 domain-containing protein
MELTPARFLSLTCEKAGLFPEAWLNSDVKVLRFQAEVFVEAAPRGRVEAPRTGP